MKCNECRFCEYHTEFSEYFCCKRDSPLYNYVVKEEDAGCDQGVPGKVHIIKAAPTSMFSEPQIELYSVVYKIDTGVSYIHKEYLVNATSQERALELAMNYFKNTAQYNESIVGDPIVHVLRKEGVISSSQAGC